MKQKLLSRIMLLLFALIAGSTSAWADKKELTFSLSSNPGGWPTANSTTLTDYTYTLNEVEYTFALKNVKCNSGYLMLTSTAALGLPAIEGYKLTKVEATNSGGCSTSTKVGISSSASEAKYVTGGEIQTWSTTSTTYTYNLTETSVNTMYYMYVTNKNSQVVSLTLTYETNVQENEVTFSYSDHKGQTVPDYGANITLSKTDVDITNTWYYCAYTDSYATFFGTNGSGTITITPKNGATITKVVFTTPFTSYNGYQSEGTITASEGGLSINTVDKVDATETTWEGSATDAITLTYHKTIRWTSIVVTYSGGTPTCETPVISGETPFLTYTTVSITCPTSGALIQYCTSTDGVNYTAYTPYAAPFQISATTQVKAKATKEGLADSKEAAKIFTQQGAIPNIKYLISVGTAPQYVQLENALVTYKNGNTAYLEDATGAIMLYNCAGTLAAGDKINGYMHVTGYSVYNGLPEITEFELVEGYTKTSGNEVTPVVVTLAELLGGDESAPYEMYLSQYVKIENATVTTAFTSKSCTITQGGYSIALRDNGSNTLTSKVGDVVTVTGNVAIFNTTKQITVYVQDQIVAGEAPADPTITVTPSSLTGLTYMVEDGPSVAQTISVSGTNLTSDITLTMGDKKFEMSLTEDDGYASSLTLTPSDGAVAATTIYVRLRAGLEVNASYSGSIAIASTGADSKSVTLSGSVKEFVPDYASLPFAFDGGKADIESTTGLTQNGLGSDYSSSPSLKFDGTGDALVLKINERPGALTFDIKGNGFSGGTFTVQTSEDGKTYTDLESYTELGDTQNESFDNLGENVRYIKWIYTNKSSGNVAIGNINLAAYVASDTRLNPELSYATTSYEINFGDEFTAPTLTNPYNLKGITYACSKPEVVDVNEETGEIDRIRAAGTFTITATFAGDETYKEGSASYTLTVTDKRIATTVSCESIVLDIANIGSLTRLAPVVKDADGNVITYSYDGWPTEMSFEVVADDNYMIGSLDWNTGEISLNKTTGTATLKALYNHFNVNSTYQPSECTFTITVVDPSAITYYALVAEYDGKHLALTNTLSSGTYSATEVDAVNGKVITPQTDKIAWEIEVESKTVYLKNKAKDGDGNYQYLGHGSSTNLTRQTGHSDTGAKWSADDTHNSWVADGRSFIYRESAKGFKNYATGNAGDAKQGYSGYTTAYIFADGYTRDIKTTTWGTICLTNTVAADDYSGATFYSIKGKTVDKNENPVSLVLEEETGELTAGVAYIFQTNEGATKLIAAYSDETIDEPFSAADNKGLEGSFTGTAVKAGMYLLSGGKIVQCGEGCSIGANRAFIDMSEVPVVADSEAGVKLFIGSEDGISSLDAAAEGAVIYDLSGRRVSKTVKGLYIVNGKKVAVK